MSALTGIFRRCRPVPLLPAIIHLDVKVSDGAFDPGESEARADAGLVKPCVLPRGHAFGLSRAGPRMDIGVVPCLRPSSNHRQLGGSWQRCGKRRGHLNFALVGHDG